MTMENRVCICMRRKISAEMRRFVMIMDQAVFRGEKRYMFYLQNCYFICDLVVISLIKYLMPFVNLRTYHCASVNISQSVQCQLFFLLPVSSNFFYFNYADHGHKLDQLNLPDHIVCWSFLSNSSRVAKTYCGLYVV